MKLTRKQAFELSIRKWEALARGENIPEYILEMSMMGYCGLCEKYFNRGAKGCYMGCKKCPICPETEEVDDFGCHQPSHPFKAWAVKGTNENAQKVLDLIKSKR